MREVHPKVLSVLCNMQNRLSLLSMLNNFLSNLKNSRIISLRKSLFEILPYPSGCFRVDDAIGYVGMNGVQDP